MYPNFRLRSTEMELRERKRKEEERLRASRERDLYAELKEARHLDALEVARKEEAAAELAGQRGDLRILLAEKDDISRLVALRRTSEITEMLSHEEVRAELKRLGHLGREREILDKVKAHAFPRGGFLRFPGNSSRVVALSKGLRYLEEVSRIRSAFLSALPLSGKIPGLKRAA